MTGRLSTALAAGIAVAVLLVGAGQARAASKEHGGTYTPDSMPDMPPQADDDQVVDILANLYTRYGERVDKLLPIAKDKAAKTGRRGVI